MWRERRQQTERTWVRCEDRKIESKVRWLLKVASSHKSRQWNACHRSLRCKCLDVHEKGGHKPADFQNKTPANHKLDFECAEYASFLIVASALVSVPALCLQGRLISTCGDKMHLRSAPTSIVSIRVDFSLLSFFNCLWTQTDLTGPPDYKYARAGRVWSRSWNGSIWNGECELYSIQPRVGHLKHGWHKSRSVPARTWWFKGGSFAATDRYVRSLWKRLRSSLRWWWTSCATT